MNPPAAIERSDARLWLSAVLASVVLNILLVVIYFEIEPLLVHRTPPTPAKPEARSVMIVPVMPAAEPVPELEPEPESARSFARSSPDQASEAPENPSFIGERDTMATSDATPDASAPEMPSQSGIKPEYGEVETTESNYQDGDLAHDREGAPGEAPSPLMREQAEQVEAVATEEAEIGGTNEMVAREDDPAPPAETLAETPFPVERPVLPMKTEEEPKSAPEEIRETAEKTEKKEEVAEKLKEAQASSAGDQGFRGHQRKTELKGSITRGGRAALDIKAGALGKYHAAISRAIEQSWQRKVVQNLDYIKPGVIRVRVVLDPKGKVRSVGTVDEFGIGAIQKGFTHSAIYDAPLPAMPAEVKRELDGEPLELLYNFIF
ncbi:hypothetical protein [Haloferula sp.]|uniref:hypothetical protein n=1 Tax=Haloferula sp. TaxID=2497595 RepID=UPI003C73CC38